jgi:uncharacterized protein YutE (UPF0331/DUF86 family)
VSSEQKVKYASAEVLLDFAAQLVMDGVSVLHDADDRDAVQALEELGVAISREAEVLRQKRIKLGAAA